MTSDAAERDLLLGRLRGQRRHILDQLDGLNVGDTVRHGTHNRGSRNGQAKIDEVCALAIRKMHALGIPRREAAVGFGISRQAVDDIINGLGGNDSLYGFAGNDHIDDVFGTTLPGANLLYGGAGHDTIWAGGDADGAAEALGGAGIARGDRAAVAILKVPPTAEEAAVREVQLAPQLLQAVFDGRA